MERRTLVESLMITDSMKETQSKVYWKSIIIFLTFSLNPFLMGFGKAINLSGLIPFFFLTTFLSLLYFYLSSVIINACSKSRASGYTELFNNYFHRMDRLVNFSVFIYGISYISLVQVFILISIISSYRDIAGYNEVISDYLLVFIFLLLNAGMIFLSWSQELKDYYKACVASLILWVLTVLGAIIAIFGHSKEISKLMDCKNYFFSGDFYLSVYVLVVIVNIFQSLTLIYKDIRESNLAFKKETYDQSLRIALAITLSCYLLLGFLLSFTERIASSRSPGPESFGMFDLLMQFYRLFRIFWFILQVCLMMLTVKSSFAGTILSADFEISKKISLCMSAGFVLLSNFGVYYVYTNPSKSLRDFERHGEIGCYTNEWFDEYYDPNIYDDYDPVPYNELNLIYYGIHSVFMVNAYCSVLVGLVIPWGLMIRTAAYSLEKIIGIGCVIVLVLASVVCSSFYNEKDFYFPI